MILLITDWNSRFENAASRKLKRVAWVAIPNEADSEGYTFLVDHPHGAAHLGAWYAIVAAASKQPIRGQLPAGIVHDLEGISGSLGRMSRLPAEVFREVIPRLIEIGWVEKAAESADALAESADVSAGAGKKWRIKKGMEGKGIEGKEQNGTTRTERHTREGIQRETPRNGRCVLCSGTGLQNGGYCRCPLGQDLAMTAKWQGQGQTGRSAA